MLKKIAPESKVKRMLKQNLSLKKAALTFVDAVDFIDRKAVTRVALETVKNYKARVKAGTADLDDLKKDPKLLINRVQNQIIFQVHNRIQEKYKGQRARWLPSDADEPRPEHQLNYGKVYTIGEGINGVEPGDEYGCQCGVEILVNETQLELE